MAASSAAPPCPDFVIEGFGRNTTGGCGGRTIYVTNLNNSGAGSLRDAVSQSGPRIVKFQVSGWITLTSILKLFNSDITIDGSDAPNGGVGIRGAIFSMSANNVILRHLRFRSGVTLPDGGNDVDRDAVQIGSDNGSVPYDVVIDHCEFAWGDDGNLDITNSAHDITVQWSMIYENFGPGNMLLGSGGIGDSGDGATRITLHHNLFAQGSRNPEINTGEGDLVNNVFYRNFDGRDFYGPGQHLGFANLTRVQPWDSPAPLWNIVGNYYKPGGLEYLVEPGRQRQIYFYGGLPQSGRALLYVEGNIGPSRPDEGRSELDIVNQNDGGLAISATRFSYPAVTTSTASQAYAEVVANAGATLPCRDAVSARVMSEVISGTGRYPEAEEDFGFYGGYPNLLRPCEGISRIMGRHERSPRTVK